MILSQCRPGHACFSASRVSPSAIKAPCWISQAPSPQHSEAVGTIILNNYAPATAHYGFHFQAYNSNIFTPVIRSEVRNETVSNEGHYTVYLPAYDDKRIMKILLECPEVKWEVFSKHNKKIIREKNIVIRPISNKDFIRSMATSAGVLCGAGFETPAEALFLGKKLMVIPMQHQYEQQCNAAALKEMGVPVLKKLKEKHLPAIKNWIASTEKISVDYKDETQAILNRIIAENTPLEIQFKINEFPRETFTPSR